MLIKNRIHPTHRVKSDFFCLHPKFGPDRCIPSISIGHVISPKTQKVDRKRVRVQFNWNVSKSDDDDDDDTNEEKNARTTITMSNG